MIDYLIAIGGIAVYMTVAAIALARLGPIVDKHITEGDTGMMKFLLFVAWPVTAPAYVTFLVTNGRYGRLRMLAKREKAVQALKDAQADRDHLELMQKVFDETSSLKDELGRIQAGLQNELVESEAVETSASKHQDPIHRSEYC